MQNISHHNVKRQSRRDPPSQLNRTDLLQLQKKTLMQMFARGMIPDDVIVNSQAIHTMRQLCEYSSTRYLKSGASRRRLFKSRLLLETPRLCWPVCFINIHYAGVWCFPDSFFPSAGTGSHLRVKNAVSCSPALSCFTYFPPPVQ